MSRTALLFFFSITVNLCVQSPIEPQKQLYKFNHDGIETIIWYSWLCNQLGQIYKSDKADSSKWITSWNQRTHDDTGITIDKNPFQDYKLLKFTQRYSSKQLSSIVLVNNHTKHFILGTMGTQTLRDGGTDLWIGNWFTTDVHWGFNRIVNTELKSLQKLDIDWTEYKHITFVGHSLGGAVAFMLATEIVKANPALKNQLDDHNIVECVQFGAPQVYSMAELKRNKMEIGLYKNMTNILVYLTKDPIVNTATNVYGASLIDALGLQYDTYDAENGGTHHISVPQSVYQCKLMSEQFCHRSGDYFAAMKAMYPSATNVRSLLADYKPKTSVIVPMQVDKANYVGYSAVYFVIMICVYMQYQQ